jgi:small conductance mechanosensitive channel
MDALSNLRQNLEGFVDNNFNFQSFGRLVLLILIAFVVGRIITALLRRLNTFFSNQADKSNHLPTVERYRRAETIVVVSIAAIRVFLFVFAIYLWWLMTHPGNQPTALIGASALFALIAGGVLSPVLRDLAAGSMMMTEHWFGVGDHIKVEPFADMQGVVERVTLRSTRIRGINGEVIWINNQNIGAVRVATKGIRTIAIELFVSEIDEGRKLVEEADLRLPGGSLMVVSPLKIVSLNEVAPNMWHITAVGQTAPGREWLLEKYAIEVIQELDSKLKASVLKSEPIARYADKEAERKFSRAIKNARKVAVRPSITTQLQEAAREAGRRERRERQQRRKKN